jgi:hypothetical protein
MTNVVGLDFDYKTSRLYYTQIAPEAKIGWMVTSDPKANDHVILNKGIYQRDTIKGFSWPFFDTTKFCFQVLTLRELPSIGSIRRSTGQIQGTARFMQ